jgi:GNAT superfamily N-acetyltransferase
MQQTVTTTHLEMTSPDQLAKKPAERKDVLIMRAEVPNPDLNHFLFMSVGLPWQWYSRLAWRRNDWASYLNSPEVQTWVGYLKGTPFGYFELEQQSGADVEIKFFGLLPEFIGQGLGSYLLSCTIEQAWALGASRVWLHTCTLDHPTALGNYQNRGFKIFKVESEVEEIPDENDPVWLSPNFYKAD